MDLAYSQTSFGARLSFFPVITALIVLVAASGMLWLLIMAGWSDPGAAALCGIAICVMRPDRFGLILLAAIMPVRDRSRELATLLAPAYREAKARLILAGSKLPAEIKLEIRFEQTQISGAAHLLVSSNLSARDEGQMAQDLNAALRISTTRLQRMKMALRTFSASLPLPDPEISNHFLLEVAKRNRAA